MAVVLPVLIQRQSGSPQDLRTRRQDSHFALQPRVMRALRRLPDVKRISRMKE